MAGNIEIALEDLRFYSYHGYYPEEQVLGNAYSLTLRTMFSKSRIEDDGLEHTVNYETLYAIATASMAQPRKLLETVAFEIQDKIREAFPFLSFIEVSICKLNPPFGGDKASARICLTWNNKEIPNDI